jgi:hypothetical protein
VQALLAAGFRIEEYAMMRALLDHLGAKHVKVIICNEKILFSPQSVALQEREIDWQSPRIDGLGGGGGWGSHRAILFGGLSLAQQVRWVRSQLLACAGLATLVRLTEGLSAGLPCTTVAWSGE